MGKAPPAVSVSRYNGRMSRFRSLVPTFFLFVILVAPLGASAAETGFFGPLIPEICNCPEGAAWGCVLGVINNTINLALSLGVIFAVLLFTYAGALFVLNPINAENRSKGKKVMLNTVVGLVIALGAWLIVNTILTVLTNYTVESATSILGTGQNCLPNAPGSSGTGGTTDLGVQPPAQPEELEVGADMRAQAEKINAFTQAASAAGLRAVYEVLTSERQGALTQAGVSGEIISVPYSSAEHFSVYMGFNCEKQAESTKQNLCTNCVALQDVQCKNNCRVVPELAERLENLSFSARWQVTEAYPPTRAHQCLCHSKGTCVDVNFIPGY